MTQGKRARISVICTVRNELKTIRTLVDSLLKQTRQADEIVFSDGGSSDGTVDVLKSYGRRVRVISAPGANIARGRNVAIAAAKGEWIASIDGGCVADRNWLAELERKMPFSDVVSGAYTPLEGGSRFERLQGLVVCKPVNRIGPGFLPSSRSVAFKKSAWLAVGGYPEDTYTAEDTIFDLALKRTGFRFSLARNALVFWRMRPNLGSFAKQFRLYGYGDGKTGLVFKMPKNLVLVAFSVFSATALLLRNPLPVSIMMAFFCWEAAGLAERIADFPELLALVAVKRISYVIGVVGGLFGV
ncbi:MAG: glycosyltransferase [archaeon]